MSASLRFLALALVGWAGVRAATLGMIPGAEAFTLRQTPAGKPKAAVATSPAIAPTEFPPIEPPPQFAFAAPPGAPWPGYPASPPQPIGVPIYYYPVAAGAAPAQFVPAALPAPRRRPPLTPIAPDPEPLFYSPIPQLDEWPLSRLASTALPARRSATAIPQQSVAPGAAQAKLDRLQLSAWALLRGQPGPSSLASGGMLGGSQAGAHLSYYITPAIAASLRSSSPVGGSARGGEIAAGIRYRPFQSIPLSITAERRQAIGRFGGGRSAFALFVEGGVYQRPMPWRFDLDAYAQAGVVGIRRRDLFADGGLTLTRPLFGQFSAGLGLWGGVQPGLYRVDAGPRLSMRVRHNMRVHLDWRQRVAGNAAPGSGPAVTLAGDF